MTLNSSERTYKVCEPSLFGNELRYVVKALLAGDISGKGSYVSQFEKAFAKKLNIEHAVAVSNGSIALFIACQALGIGRGDNVICPTFTMAATAFAPMLLGAKCKWVDCLKEGNINPSLIEKKIDAHTKAILVTHIYGVPCKMDMIMDIAQKHSLPVIEDAAEAHGAIYNGKLVGTWGDMGCFSFYANKIVTCGEGGIIVTRKAETASLCRMLRDYAMMDTYVHERPALNGRISNLAAAVGMAQIESMERLIMTRVGIAQIYDNLFANCPAIKCMERPLGSVCWMYPIRVKNRDEVMEGLKSEGIETRPFFVPMHKQPFNTDKGDYPIAEFLSEQGLYLPTYGHLTLEDIEHITERVKFYAK